MPLSVDSRIVSLATQVTDSPDQEVPVLLLKLKDILTSTPPGSKESQKIRQNIYYYDLLRYCLLVLLQDFTRIPGGWATAAQIAEILSLCCVGLEVKEEPEEYYDKLLPSAIDNLLYLGRHLQARFIRAVKEEEKREFLHYFKTVTDAICWLCGGHAQLTKNVLRNEHFQQLLMSNDVETSTVIMTALENILRVNSAALLQLTKKALHCILDELVYKLSSTINLILGSIAVNLLLFVAEFVPQLLTTLVTRYKGLQTLLSKQWTGKGFDGKLCQLLDMLYSENYKANKTQRLHQAACLIQAAWRGFQTRQRLKLLLKAVTILQRSFRAKQARELQGFKKQKEDEGLKQQLQLQRQRAMRLFHERQLTLLEIVDAGQVDKHMREIEEKAAITIQRYWRAFRTRKNFLQQKQYLKQYKAAVVIQRMVLKFLARRRKCSSPWKHPKALSDEHRISLQEKVNDYIKQHPASEMSEEMSKKFHQEAQERLAQYLLKKSLDRKAQQHREALLIQVHTDVDLLMHAPSLAESSMSDLNIFMSRSVPVIAKAKQSHSTMLQYTRWPWWKKLGEEFLDEEGVSEDLLSGELGILFIGGSKT